MPIKKEVKERRHTCALCRKKRIERRMRPLIWTYWGTPINKAQYKIWACGYAGFGYLTRNKEACFETLLKRHEASEIGKPKLDL